MVAVSGGSSFGFPIGPDLGSVPYYAVWIILAAAYAVAWRARGTVALSRLSRRELAIVAVIATAAFAMYEPRSSPWSRWARRRRAWTLSAER